jgi:hypothetical protein
MRDEEGRTGLFYLNDLGPPLQAGKHPEAGAKSEKRVSN